MRYKTKSLKLICIFLHLTHSLQGNDIAYSKIQTKGETNVDTETTSKTYTERRGDYIERENIVWFLLLSVRFS